ncbi:response regulator transcription factor [Nocardioides xinjiangensis]|uniref:response regulator transcription factor n=1 Tax=Nocardioides xinjiangensis TaxID=2817376 RepID=UPI001B301855|nr:MULTISPECIES: response regulator transcription factor [unclassified Nocardioides]
MIGVLVVDDQQLIRNAVAELVAHEPDMHLVETAENGVDAVRKAKELAPDVVVMDVRMPVMDGIEATRIITQDEPGVRVLILTTFEDEPEYVVRGVRSGAAGFVGKGAEPEVIVEAIRTVHRGEGLLTPRATKNLLDRYAGAAGSGQLHPDLRSLTPREIDILRLVAEGQTNQAIADDLGISVVTVKTHINRTMTKVGRHDRAQLVVLAFETGLVTPRYR